jgi:hypothetical protein
MSRLGDSFFEQIGFGLGFHLSAPRGGVFFNQGGFDSALPPFGGYQPNDVAAFSFGSRGPRGGFSIRFAAGQGASRSLVSQGASVTVPNGGVGWVADSVLRPFVTGIVPVVGAVGRSPVLERLSRMRELSQPSSAASSAGGQRQDRRSVHRGEQPSFSRPAAERSTAEQGDLSVAEIRDQLAADDEAKEREVRSLLTRARQLEQAGKPGVARIYYQQAASRASAALRRELQEKAKLQ